MLIDLGYGMVHSSLYTKYSVTIDPAYAYVKPWWMATFSGKILESTILDFSGRLLPGFCPYNTIFSESNMYDIQTLVQNTINVNESNYIFSFVWDQTFPPFGWTEFSNGIFNFSKTGLGINDLWISIEDTESKFIQTDNDINQSPPAIIAVIVSLVFAGFLSLFFLQIFIIASRVIYKKVLDAEKHATNYNNILRNENLDQNSKKKKVNEYNKIKDKKSKSKNPKVIKKGFREFLKNAPSVSAFTDYSILIFRRNTTNSIREFYYYLFSVAKNGEADPVNNPEQINMNLNELKVYYEKFCFLNHYIERNLQDKSNLVLFSFQESKNSLSCIYIKMLIKDKGGKLELDPEKIDKKIDQDSLDIFMKSHIELTQFDSDSVNIYDFEQLYNKFCEYNGLEKVISSVSLMQNKYHINTKNIPTTHLTRRLQEDDHNILKILNEGYAALSGSKEFKIDRDNLQNHFDMLTKNYAKMTPEAKSNSTVQMIVFPGWYIWDVMTVAFHLNMLAATTLPMLLIIFLMEYSYYPWSLKDPSFLILP